MKANIRPGGGAELKPRKKIRAPDPPSAEKRKQLEVPKIIEPAPQNRSSENLEFDSSFVNESVNDASVFSKGIGEGRSIVTEKGDKDDVESSEKGQNGLMSANSLGSICLSNENGAIQNQQTTALEPSISQSQNSLLPYSLSKISAFHCLLETYLPNSKVWLVFQVSAFCVRCKDFWIS